MAYTTIKKPSDYFNTKLYTGTGASASITGVGFQPDWVWIKSRTSADWHILTDAIRGATTEIYTNATNGDNTNVNQLTSFDSDGFSLGGANDTGRSGENFVAWNWLGANGTASNTDGSITSTVSANTTSGFSIVSYTGTGANATVGHGLGSVPKMVIIKDRDDGGEPWFVYHSSIGNTGGILLNSSNATVTSSTWFNDTSPTSSVFSIGSNGGVTGSGENFIAYCFSEVKGFSKFGSYTGNGNADGTFVYTGFKPAFLIWKQTNAAGEAWGLFDNKRDPYNFVSLRLPPNATDTEGSPSAAASCDFLSNGFKWRSSFNSRNGSGSTYIYMAFAEQPLVGDNPATAR